MVVGVVQRSARVAYAGDGFYLTFGSAIDSGPAAWRAVSGHSTSERTERGAKRIATTIGGVAGRTRSARPRRSRRRRHRGATVSGHGRTTSCDEEQSCAESNAMATCGPAALVMIRSLGDYPLMMPRSWLSCPRVRPFQSLSSDTVNNGARAWASRCPRSPHRVPKAAPVRRARAFKARPTIAISLRRQVCRASLGGIGSRSRWRSIAPSFAKHRSQARSSRTTWGP
jgi:hypothetical protein